MTTYRLAESVSDDLLTQLLHSRGLSKVEEIEAFLNPNYDTDRHDPYLLNDMAPAVERLQRAIKDNERITIYSDYDCDGIPGAVILHDFFKAVGFTNFTNYIPHRHFEGFGLSVEAVEKLADEGTKLIVTVDCGTADRAAVVFKLTEALLATGDFSLTPGKEKWWLDMVALATVGDMVPLTGENRVLTRWGLEVLRKSRRPGLQQLLRQARADQRRLNEDDIGFTIAPRINAASRMDTPEDAFLMLSASEEGEAGARALRLHKLNNERKGIVAAMTKELKKKLSEMLEIPDVLVLGNPEWRPSLVGLCANSLATEYARPVFLWGRDGNGVIKGSCRSGGEVSVVKLMEATAEHFSENGGHHAAGGFSIKEESVFHLPQILNEAYRTLGEAALQAEELVVDGRLHLDDVDNDLVKTLQQLSPYGVGNPKPLFAFEQVTPTRVEQFGKHQEHLKLTFSARRELEAIAFFAEPKQFQREPKVGEELTLLAHVEESFFMNRRQIRLRIVDIVTNLT